MGIFHSGFRALPWAIGIMAVVFFTATVLDFSFLFSGLFSWTGFLVMGFMIFSIATMREL